MSVVINVCVATLLSPFFYIYFWSFLCAKYNYLLLINDKQSTWNVYIQIDSKNFHLKNVSSVTSLHIICYVFTTIAAQMNKRAWFSLLNYYLLLYSYVEWCMFRRNRQASKKSHRYWIRIIFFLFVCYVVIDENKKIPCFQSMYVNA